MASHSRRFFVSFSGKKGSDSAVQAEKFRNSLREVLDCTTEDIYCFTEPEVAPPGADIYEEIREALTSSQHLVCLISNDYFRSATCLYEYYSFFTRTGREPIYIFREPRFLADDLYKNNLRLREAISRGISTMEENKDATKIFTDELKTFGETVWIDKLVAARGEKRHFDLRTAFGWNDTLRNLKVALGEITCSTLREYAALSAYCLGADRYKTKGWGFSLGEVFTFDSVDGDELPNGPFGLNVVAIRALANFLEDIDLEDERQSIFTDVNVKKRMSHLEVADRLPYFAALLACLDIGHAGLPSLGVIVNHSLDPLTGWKQVSDARETIEVTSRWTVDTRGKAAQSDEYHCVLLSCLCKAEEFLNTTYCGSTPDETSRQQLATALKGTWLDKDTWLDKEVPFRTQLRECVDQAVQQNDMFDLVLGDFSGLSASEIQQRLKAAIIWLVLAGSHEGIGLLDDHIRRKFKLSHGNDKQVEFLERVREKIGEQNAEVLTMLLALCAATLCSRESFGKQLFGVLREQYFERDAGYYDVARLNAVAWTAIIIIAFHEAAPVMKQEIVSLRELWALGINLRKQRLDAVTRLSTEDPQNLKDSQRYKDLTETNLKAEMEDVLSQHGKWWVERVLASEMENPEEHMERFVTAMMDGTFWARPNTPGPVSRDLLGGVLRVTLDNRVEMDSPGYNRMFLYPFSEITGMNVTNLNDIKREFGDDRMLVRMMAETVVKAVYARVGNGYESRGDKFFQRTEEIVDKFKGKLLGRENSADDVLKVRVGKGSEVRWVFRSALLQEPRRKGGDRIISWRFVEMPEGIAKLIVPSGGE